MADEETMNGGDLTLEISENEDLKGSKLLRRIDVLEQEKGELVRDNEAVREKISKLEGELRVLESEKAELEREIVRSDADKKSLESVASRAAELEIEVSRLQHDLITAEADGAEANKEVSELKREVKKLKESDFEKGQKLDVLEKERALLLEKLGKMEDEMRDGKEAGEERVCELKKKLEGLLDKESGEKAKIVEKDSEILELKKRADDLELVIVRKDEEMEKMKKEREELEGAKRDLEMIMQLMEKRVKELEKLGLLKENEINGIHAVGDGERVMYGLKLQWPLLAASAGVVTIGALCYLRMRQR